MPVHTQRAGEIDLAPLRLAPGLRGCKVQVAALMKAGRNAGFRLKPLIKLARVFRDPGQGLGRHAGRGYEPCRMPGGAGGQLIPLQHQDVRPAGLGEVIGRRGADDAAPDNNGAGMGVKGLRQGVTPKVR